jgi:CheY-like chemotaxis protein
MFDLVFIIDDSPLERLISEMLIRRAAFARQVLCFSSGQEALDHLELNAAIPENLPELIFLDIQMPLMTGFDFLDRYLRLQSQLTRSSVFYIMSSTLNDEDFTTARNYKIVDKFLPKPLTAEMLDELSAAREKENRAAE